MRLAVLIAALAVAGCVDPAAPETDWQGTALRDIESQLWVATSNGCGHCSGTTQNPEFRATGYYQDGSVLAIDYGRGTGPEPVQFAYTVDPALHDDVRAFFARHDAYGEHRDEDGASTDIRVHEVHARRLAQPAGIDAELEARIQATSPPQDTGSMVYDCGPTVAEVWPEPGRVRFGCGRPVSGWDDVLAVMQDLDAWARESPAAHRGAPAWTDAEGDLWFTHTMGCTMCGFFGGTNPKASTLALYTDGSVLWFNFAMGPDNITFAPGLEPWQDEVLAVHEAQHGGRHSNMTHVVDIHVTRATDWPATQARLQALHDVLPDPGPDDRSGCADCGGPWVEAYQPHVHGALFGNYEEGDAWDRLLAELRAFNMQVETERSD